MKKLLIAVLMFSALVGSTAFAGSGNLPGFGYYPYGGGVVPKWAGFTALSYDGNQGGYDSADALCAANYSASHVCRVDEILALINNDSPMPAAGEGWINGGPPGYTANANDCQGWTSAALAYYGRYFDFSVDQGWMRGCIESMPFACCETVAIEE